MTLSATDIAPAQRLAEQLLILRDSLAPGERATFDAILRAAADDQDEVAGYAAGLDDTPVGRLARAVGLSAVALSFVLALGAAPAAAATPPAPNAIVAAANDLTGFVVGPNSLHPNETQTWIIKIQGNAGEMTNVRFDVSSQDLPLRFVSIRNTQEHGAGDFTCAIVDSTAPSARVVCKGGHVAYHTTATFELTTRTGAISNHGQGTMTMRVDPANTIAETNENNNGNTRTITY